MRQALRPVSVVVAIAIAIAVWSIQRRGPVADPSFAAAASAGVGFAVENLNATLWTQTGAEYEASARQAYRLADVMMNRALEDSAWSASLDQLEMGGYEEYPPAVILDVDETVLDNSAYQARLVLDNSAFESTGWNEWVREENAVPVPGALEFTLGAAARGVTVLYVTNRAQELSDATRANLVASGFPMGAGDTLYPRPPDTASDKGERRRALAARYRILLLIGDNLGDFVSDVRVDQRARQQLVADNASRWGEQWIVLPNPQYGSWESALYDYDFGLDREGKYERKAAALRPAR